MWHWLIHTDAGLLLRIGIGAAIFATLALVDLRANGRQARRWREYTFLLGVVAVALLYGILNDQITSRISWEYFYYGKELAPTLGPQTPPDPAALSREAVVIGAKATWSAGLLVGVALLIANNPRPGRAQLGYARLARHLVSVLVVALICSVGLGLAGYAGWLAFLSSDFRELLATPELRPRRFMTVYGIHLGGYLGGLVGTVIAVIGVRRARRLSSGVQGN